MKKCLVIGAAMLDIVMQIDELPKKGEDVYAKSQTMTVGGCAYNVADGFESEDWQNQRKLNCRNEDSG